MLITWTRGHRGGTQPVLRGVSCGHVDALLSRQISPATNSAAAKAGSRVQPGLIKVLRGGNNAASYCLIIPSFGEVWVSMITTEQQLGFLGYLVLWESLDLGLFFLPSLFCCDRTTQMSWLDGLTHLKKMNVLPVMKVVAVFRRKRNPGLISLPCGFSNSGLSKHNKMLILINNVFFVGALCTFAEHTFFYVPPVLLLGKEFYGSILPVYNQAVWG